MESGRSLEIESWPRMFLANLIKSLLTVRRMPEEYPKGSVEWIVNGIDGRIWKVFWRCSGDVLESRRNQDRKTKPARVWKMNLGEELFLAKFIKSVLTEELNDFKFCFVKRRKRCDGKDGGEKSAQNWSEMRWN